MSGIIEYNRVLDGIDNVYVKGDEHSVHSKSYFIDIKKHLKQLILEKAPENFNMSSNDRVAPFTYSLYSVSNMISYCDGLSACSSYLNSISFLDKTHWACVYSPPENNESCIAMFYNSEKGETTEVKFTLYDSIPSIYEKVQIVNFDDCMLRLSSKSISSLLTFSTSTAYNILQLAYDRVKPLLVKPLEGNAIHDWNSHLKEDANNSLDVLSNYFNFTKLLDTNTWFFDESWPSLSNGSLNLKYATLDGLYELILSFKTTI